MRELAAGIRSSDAAREPGGWLAAVTLSALIVVYANGLALLAGPRQAEPSAFFATGNLFALPLLLVGVAVAYRRRWGALGWSRPSLAPGLRIGLAVGVAMALPAVATFTVPPLMGEPLRWSVAAEMSAPAVLSRLLLHLTLGTALFEELLFRGVLWNLFYRARGTAVAWLGTSLVFALWHVVLTVQTVGQTNVPPHLSMLAVLLGLLGVFGGGLVFGALRFAAGLTAPMAAHWTVDAVMLLALVLRAS